MPKINNIQMSYTKFVENNDKVYKDYYSTNPTYECCDTNDNKPCIYKKQLVERFKFLESFDYETLVKINSDYLMPFIDIEQTLSNDNRGFIIYIKDIEWKYWIDSPSNCARYWAIVPFSKKPSILK